MFGADSGTVQDAVLDVMMAGLGIGGNDQYLVSLSDEPVPQDFNVGDHPVDVGQKGFGK